MITKKLDHTINFWIEELKPYNFEELSTKPSPTGWSLGQMYMHLIEATEFYLEQANSCLSNNANAHEQASLNAKIMFRNDEFPNQIMEGPPSNAHTPEPKNKEEIMSGLRNLRLKLRKVELNFLHGSLSGKTRHPGLQYFDANEWLQFADMHLRHHMRQKLRIDSFLKKFNNSEF